jgi:hypoxanthine phosphoribosyltransferase
MYLYERIILRSEVRFMEATNRILFNEQAIEQRITELAQDISRDYAVKEVVAVCILKGALVFFTDLTRQITIPITIDFIQASSYGSGTVSSRNIAISNDISTSIRNKHVLLIDTIIDTGETMAYLYKRFSEQGPASLAVVGLLDKRPRRTVEVPVTYKGFEIPDLFVVGYGMDYGEQYRNLPYIAVLEGDR